MGLNVNHILLTERESSDYHIPAYIKHYKPDFISESDAMKYVIEFNNCLRDARASFDEIKSIYEVDSIEFANKNAEIWSKVLDAVTNIKIDISNMITSTISSMKSSEEYADDVDRRFKLSERVKILKDRINSIPIEWATIKIGSIDENPELLSENIPNVNVVGKNLIEVINRILGDSISDSRTSDFRNNHQYDYSDLDELMENIFSSYGYEAENIHISARNFSNCIFTHKDREVRHISDTMYLTACENLSESDKVIAMLRSFDDKVNDNFSSLQTKIKDLYMAASKLDIDKPDEDSSMTREEKIEYNECNIKNAVTIIKAVVNAIYNITYYKMRRINQIYSRTGDSFLVKTKCSQIIKGAVESNIISAKEISREVEENCSNITLYFDMLEEALLEHQYDNHIMRVLNEDGEAASGSATASGENNAASSGNNDSTTTSTTTTSTSTTTASTEPKKEKGFIAWLKRIFKTIIGWFKKSTDNIIAVASEPSNQEFWKNTRDTIKNSPPSNSTINDFNKYNIDALQAKGNYSESKALFKKFTLEDQDFTSDENMQKYIMRQLGGQYKPVGENEKFEDQVKAFLNGEHINDENGNGREIKSVYNASDLNKIFDFVDRIMNSKEQAEEVKAMKGEISRITKEDDRLNKEYESLSRQLAEKLKASPAAPAEQSAEPKKESTNMSSYEDILEEEFNLAEWFGLPINEVKTTPAGADLVHSKGEDYEGRFANKELNERLKRYRIIGTTIGIKCASMNAAFKQYLAIYRAIYTNSKAKTDEKTDVNKTTVEKTNTEEKKQEETKK